MISFGGIGTTFDTENAEMQTRRLLGLALLLAGCSTAGEVVEVPIADSDCSVTLTARPAHPFLAEFKRKVLVACGADRESLRLELDPGGLGRVEVSRFANAIVIVDAFESARLDAADAKVLSRDVHPGKIDTYDSACARKSVFKDSEGDYLGAFDYCDHRWQFLRP